MGRHRLCAELHPIDRNAGRHGPADHIRVRSNGIVELPALRPGDPGDYPVPHRQLFRTFIYRQDPRHFTFRRDVRSIFWGSSGFCRLTFIGFRS